MRNVVDKKAVSSSVSMGLCLNVIAPQRIEPISSDTAKKPCLNRAFFDTNFLGKTYLNTSLSQGHRLDSNSALGLILSPHKKQELPWGLCSCFHAYEPKERHPGEAISRRARKYHLLYARQGAGLARTIFRLSLSVGDMEARA